MVTEREALLKRAIEHYIGRLRRIENEKEDEQIIAGGAILKQDLERNIREVEQAVNNFDSEYQSMDYRKILCSALSCYIKDLEQSKKAVYEKLPSLGLVFENIDKDLQIAFVAVEQICKAHGIQY